VARLGGDEFGILLPRAGQEGAIRVAGKIRAALAEPVGLGEATAWVGASIGIALYPEHGDDAQTLKRGADRAMYGAKGAGGGYRVQGEDHEEAETALPRLETDLRRTIAGGELRLWYQPIVRCATGQVTRVEALVRWEHPRLGLLPPDRFIPVAERTGAITALTVWVLEEAIRQGADWLARGLDLGLAVNISPISLKEPRFADLVAALLRQYDLPAAALTIEMTESTLLAEPERAVTVLEALAGTGVRLAIDDFGRGYSSMSQLRRLPVQELKLDRSVLAELDNEKNSTLLAFLLGLGVALGVEVVVKGVETAATWEWLVGMGCELAQGFYVSLPQPAESLEPWLRAGPWRPSGQNDAARVEGEVGLSHGDQARAAG